MSAYIHIHVCVWMYVKQVTLTKIDNIKTLSKLTELLVLMKLWHVIHWNYIMLTETQ